MNISTPDAVSISLSVFCIVISLIILFSGLFDQGRGLKISRIFRFFIFSNIGFMLSDIVMRFLEGNAEWYVFYVLWVFALIHYISGPLILASMTLYMLAYISIRVKVARVVHIVVYSICGLSILLTIVSQFNNMYYFIDENTVMQSFIDAGDNERIEAYLNEHVRTLPVYEEIMYCKNFAVNSMLRYYADIAKKEGIKVDARLDLAENAGVSDSDLCIIFGNCMENAIEACRRFGGDKFIKISAKPIGKMLAITIDNSFDGNVKRTGDVFMSLKRKGEGIGTSSVKAVARKYNGSAQFNAEDNVFQVSILLRVV